MNMNKVGIVVVTYNRLALLKEVIGSLRSQTYENFDIVVVNNGSTDETESWLTSNEDIITITQANLGGAGGFYTGMRYVAEHDYEFCWVMDDDVICSPTALEELMKAVKVRDNIGFVCSRVLGTDGRPMNTPEPAIKSMSEDTYSDIFELVNVYSLVRVQSSTFVSVLVPTNIIYEVGLPYKEFFIWGDDIEFTSRISCRFPSYVACKSVVVHKRSLQAPLSFYTEPDRKRLKNYFYKFRNESFINMQRGTKRGIIQIARSTLTLLSLLFKADFTRLGIFIRSQWALLSFHPKIEFPR